MKLMNKRIKTQRIRIYPTDEQRSQLSDLQARYMQACNFVSYFAHSTGVYDYAALNKELGTEIMDKFMLNRQMSQSVGREVEASYKKSKGRKVEFKKPHCKWTTRDWNIRDKGFDGKISISLGKKLDCRHYFILVDYKRTAYTETHKGRQNSPDMTISEENGKMYINIAVSEEIESFDLDDGITYVGIDLGSNIPFAMFDGNDTYAVFLHEVDKLMGDYEQRKASFGGKRSRSAKKRLAKVKKEYFNRRRAMTQAKIRDILNIFPRETVFALEDLSDLYKNTRASYSYISDYLKDKIIQRGSLFVEIDPAYTSQTCPSCGVVDKSNRNKLKHRYTCECGYEDNDDVTAAINIYNRGKQEFEGKYLN